jgi:mxaK protein
MALNRRAVRRAAWAALASLGALALIDAWSLHRAMAWNALIESGAMPADTPGAPLEIRFAQAYAQAASGADEAALTRYGALHGDTPLGQAARYNSANLLLRQGAALRAGAQPGQALAFIELAKEGYRDVLRHDPHDWPARYNLERAQRLVPDPDEADEAPPELNRNAERAATTMRGYSPGLP